METKISSVKENPLLERKELQVEVNHQGEETPSKEDVKNRVAAENDIDTDNLEVENVYTGYGSQKSTAYLKVFQDFEYDEELEEDALQNEETEVTPEAEDIVDQSITDVKDELEDASQEKLETALEAEKQNKDRKTLKNWIKERL